MPLSLAPGNTGTDFIIEVNGQQINILSLIQSLGKKKKKKTSKYICLGHSHIWHSLNESGHLETQNICS